MGNEAVENCSHNCDSCGESCSARKMGKADFAVPMNAHSNIKHVIAVMSGKGGVGKSFVTSALAVQMQKKGYKVAFSRPARPETRCFPTRSAPESDYNSER